MIWQKKKARAFVKAHALCHDNLTPEYLSNIIRRMGFTLYRHNKNGVSAETTELVLDALRLTEYAKGRNGFTYVSGTDKMMFLHEQLSDNEAVCVLLHELGHILYGHLSSPDQIFRGDALCEQEAGEFVLYVMQYATKKSRLRIAFIFGLVSLFAAVLVLSLGKGFLFPLHVETPSSITPTLESIETPISSPSLPSQVPVLKSDSVEAAVYVTKSGTVYHTADCHYIEGRQGVRAMASHEAEELSLPPCSYCRPDKIE